MSNYQILTLDGGSANPDAASIDSLKSTLQGTLAGPGDSGYEEARTLWNAMIDRRPALIARCTSAADVQAAVRFAGQHKLLTAVRSGGHNIAGNAVCEGGFMIDLSQMKDVRIDESAKRAHVSPGATLGDFDAEAQKFAVAAPLGINSTTGVAGLTLGGGFGWLSRKHGFTVDALRAADVVTADGELVTASESDHAELFWAIRGGGGNFGVVTRFEFEVYDVGPEVFAGLIVFPASEARPVLQQYREYAKSLSDDSCIWVVLRKAPPLPFLPEAVHGTDVVVLACFHNGTAEEGEKLVAPLRGFGQAHAEHFGMNPFAGWQQAFDPLLTPGARNYWKSHNFTELSDGALDVALEYAGKLPSGQCEIFIAQLGGEVARRPVESTAYAHRDASYVLNVHGRWDDAADDDPCIQWSRDFFDAATPHASGGVYVNFMTEEETDRIGAAYGPGYDRLVAAKKQYDPDNFFRLNQNIKPSG